MGGLGDVGLVPDGNVRLQKDSIPGTGHATAIDSPRNQPRSTRRFVGLGSSQENAASRLSGIGACLVTHDDQRMHAVMEETFCGTLRRLGQSGRGLFTAQSGSGFLGTSARAAG